MLQHSRSQHLKLHLSFAAKMSIEKIALCGITEIRFAEQTVIRSYSKFSGLLLLEA